MRRQRDEVDRGGGRKEKKEGEKKEGSKRSRMRNRGKNVGGEGVRRRERE